MKQQFFEKVFFFFFVTQKGKDTRHFYRKLIMMQFLNYLNIIIIYQLSPTIVYRVYEYKP